MNEQPWSEALQAAREMWGEGLPATPENLQTAAVGLASQWYRNTDAVETHAHTEGPWTDPDMLRRNAWATALCRDALTSVAEASEDEVEPILEDLLEELIAMLPSGKARRTLRREKAHAPVIAAEWIVTNGLGNWLAFLATGLLYPSGWWGTPGFESIVEQLCAMDPGPPEPETFRERMLNAPWELTDAQAEFACDRRSAAGTG